MAADHAAELLSPLGDRWVHVQGVVRQAHRVAAILPSEDREVLVAAAYVHDVGYAPSVARTGLHALDGAGTCAPSAMSGWLAWWPITPVLGVRPSCVA
jgi:hypothetical protein